MKIGINCGHTVSGAGYGAIGIIGESDHTRLVGRELMRLMQAAGVQVTDCTIDHACSQNEYLEKAVKLANNEELDNSRIPNTGLQQYTKEGPLLLQAGHYRKTGLQMTGFLTKGVHAVETPRGA